jgi:flagellar hook protein FlgE
VNSISDFAIQIGGTTPRTIFNGALDGTSGNYTELQKATDVTSSASVTVYDSLGNKHTITLDFTKDASQANQWTWKASVPTPSVITAGSTGKMTFNTDGSFKSFSYDDGSSSLQFDPGAGSANLMNIDLNLGSAASFSGVTQFEGSSTISANEQDGFGLGELSSISVDQNGRVQGVFSNGTVRTMAQIMVSTFNNPGGLQKVNENMFDISGNSGVPIVGIAGESIQTKIVSGALEQSNVDLAEEFTNMIVAQRGFQANARVITTSDEFLTEVVNLKR